jgi:hypothetical protein
MYSDKELQKQLRIAKQAGGSEEQIYYGMRQSNYRELAAKADDHPVMVITSYDDLRFLRDNLTQPQRLSFIRSDGGVTDIVLFPGKGKLAACHKKLW